MRPLSRHRMLAVVALLSSVPAVAGCDVILGTYCDTNSECPSTQICGPERLCIDGDRPEDAGVDDAGVDDAGIDDAGTGDAGVDDAGINDAGIGDAGVDDAGVNDAGVDAGPRITIESIEGNGTATAVSAPPALDGGILATNRLADRLVVVGTNLATVDSATLSTDEEDFALSIEAQSDGELELQIPNTISPGLMTLTLIAASTSATAQVFVVQGEAAAPVLSTNVEATAQQCPNGGRVLTVGPDTDDDGAPDATPIVLCNGEQGVPGNLGPLSCAGGDCTLSANLAVTGDAAVDGALTADGSSVLKVITTSEERTAENYPEIVSQLQDLRNYRIAAPAIVTIRLSSTNSPYLIENPIEILHADADRIQIIGDTDAPETIVFQCADNCFDIGFSSPASFLNGFHMEASSIENGTAINAFSGGAVRLGIDLEMRDFFLGISAENGAHVIVVEDGRVAIRNCRNAVRVQGTASVVAPKLNAINNQNGVIVRQGHAVVSSGVLTGRADGSGAGLSAENGGTIFANNVRVSLFEFGLNSQTGSVLIATNGTTENNEVGASTFLGAMADLTGTVIQNNVLGVRVQTQSVMRLAGTDLTTNSTEQDVSADSLLDTF